LRTDQSRELSPVWVVQIDRFRRYPRMAPALLASELLCCKIIAHGPGIVFSTARLYPQDSAKERYGGATCTKRIDNSGNPSDHHCQVNGDH